MPRMTLPIASLIGGVSTQPEATRLPQQAELSDNCLGTVVEGLRRRPTSEFMHKAAISAATSSVQHDIHLKEGSYYLSTDGSSEFRVFDVETGEEQEVINQAGFALQPANDLAYFDGVSNAREDLRFLTLADYTLILNRNKPVYPKADTPPQWTQSYVRIVQGSYGARYLISIEKGSQVVMSVDVVTYTADNTDRSGASTSNHAESEYSVRTDTIANEMLALLAAGGTASGQPIPGVTGTSLSTAYGSVVSGPPTGLDPTEWQVDRSGSTIRIQNRLGNKFTVRLEESIGQGGMETINSSVQLFSDLPKSAAHGHIVEVIGDPDETEVSYWVKFVASDPGVELGDWAEGAWEETVGPEVAAGIEPSGMPHALIRQTDGRFRLTQLDGVAYTVPGVTGEVELPGWTDRPVGDDITNKLPDFVKEGGGYIRSMCFHEGRLGLLSETSFYLSEATSPFSFFRTTVLDVLSSDRITLKAPTRRSEVLSHCVPLGGDVVLFSDMTQYLVRSDGPWAPNSVSMTAAGQFDSDPVAEPIQVRDHLFVPREASGFGAVSSLQVLGDQRPRFDNADLTASTPRYLVKPHRAITTSELDLAVVYGNLGDELFVYAQFWANGERIQQSWQRWTIPNLGTILHAWFRKTELFVLGVDDQDQVVLLKMRCQPEAGDQDVAVTYMDYRVDSNVLDDPLESNGNHAFTLPFDPPETLVAREKGTFKEVRILSVDLDEVLVEGTPTDVYFGVPFESRHDLSRITETDSQRVPRARGVLRLDTGTVSYDESGAFDVVVIDDIAGESATHFSGPYLGQGANYQNIRLSSGELDFPIRGRSEDVRLSFRSSGTEAMRLVSLDIVIRRNRTGSRGRTQ